jgi:SAM-dependent methyltransferase
MENMVNRWAGTASVTAPQAIILGVTPEIVGMRWPENTHILAFDREPSMIQNLWPHHCLSNAAALCSDWSELPLVDGYADLVMADGSFIFLAFPGEYHRLARELARILAPGGIVVVRLFVPPDNKESVEDIYKDLWDGHIGNFNTFKWRLAMALTDSSDFSVCVNDVWESWNAHIDSAELLADRLGWSLPVIRMVERYRGCVSTRYSFPPLNMISDALAPLFSQEQLSTPTYQDGNRYPTVCFRRQ